MVVIKVNNGSIKESFNFKLLHYTLAGNFTRQKVDVFVKGKDNLATEIA